MPFNAGKQLDGWRRDEERNNGGNHRNDGIGSFLIKAFIFAVMSVRNVVRVLLAVLVFVSCWVVSIAIKSFSFLSIEFFFCRLNDYTILFPIRQ